MLRPLGVHNMKKKESSILSMNQPETNLKLRSKFCSCLLKRNVGNQFFDP